MSIQAASKYSVEDKRRVLGKAFWGISRFYDFSREEQAVLFGMSKTNRVPLKKLEESLSIPDFEAVEIIVSHLLGIHKNLGILYPRADELDGNHRLKTSWFKRPMRELNDKTPMEFILEDERPLSKITVLRRLLDLKRTST
ncbi:MAG TPA: hypothetical protein VE954_34635 [Oligoflexus sp.]|uniref:hypothetical protein n=1 Tax=Oligoflexus sp. TaxID=1971216 RepID=UPI002D574DBC|nr:hypothetical protein [Oligoflexus sp.]HYX38268.1 hypothetical protein [Oligoflexus sp.]